MTTHVAHHAVVQWRVVAGPAEDGVVRTMLGFPIHMPCRDGISDLLRRLAPLHSSPGGWWPIREAVDEVARHSAVPHCGWMIVAEQKKIVTEQRIIVVKERIPSREKITCNAQKVTACELRFVKTPKIPA
jgi:hypothetical protein